MGDPFQRVRNPCHLVHRSLMDLSTRATAASVTPTASRIEFGRNEVMRWNGIVDRRPGVIDVFCWFGFKVWHTNRAYHHYEREGSTRRTMGLRNRSR